MVKKTYPGMRFYPTDVELILFYLKRKIKGKRLPDLISEVNIYKFSPWDLPDKAVLKTGDLEWHFLCPKEMKYANGPRFNRAVEGGFWKSTGKDRPVRQDEKTVGMIKTLVFHSGHSPNGNRTNWVIHEYRIEDPTLAVAGFVQDSFVLCKLFKKSGPGPKNGEQHGAPFKEEDWDSDDDDDDDEPLLEPFKLLPEFERGECSNATVLKAALNDELLLESFNLLSEFQPGECSNATVVEARLPEPAVQTSNDNVTAMLGTFTREDFASIWDNPIEMPANNGTGGAVLEEPVVDDGNDIFCGLGDLHDWAGFHGELSTMDYDDNNALCINLNDLECPLEGGSATTQEAKADHYFVHLNSSP